MQEIIFFMPREKQFPRYFLARTWCYLVVLRRLPVGCPQGIGAASSSANCAPLSKECAQNLGVLVDFRKEIVGSRD